MDAATLQARIYAGYGKAATRIGYLTDQYRPTSKAYPVVAGNKLRSFSASFNPEDMTYGKPNKYGHPTWYGLFDGTLTQVGDYLKNDHDGTYFVAAQQQALPILMVQCNRIVDVYRPQQEAGFGVQSYGGEVTYGGNTADTQTLLMQQWPCSILQGTKGERSDVGLPGDTRNPWWQILLPAWPGTVLKSADIIIDDLGRRYVISSPELTDLGWRLTVGSAQT